MKKTVFSLAILILACCWTIEAQGHGMSLFASHDGKTITGTAEYHAGVPAVDAKVTVTDGDETEFWTTRTNPQGKFIVDVKPHDAYIITVDAGGGHRAKLKIGGVSESQNPNPNQNQNQNQNQKTSAASDVKLEALRREIYELKTAIRLRDLLGGIGYILGLVGIAMYFKAKERKS